MPQSSLPLGAPPRRSRARVQPPAAGRSALSELREGLLARPKRLPSTYFYDAAGSALFERITRLPEYYLTRAEDGLLRARAGEVAAATRAEELVELGAGAATKTRRLLDALRAVGTLRRYVPVDVDPTMVERAERSLARLYPGLEVQGIAADFAAGPLLVARDGRRLLALLGSTIGNFAGEDAVALLRRLARLLCGGDTLLLGADLVKDQGLLHAAYNDAEGVTAAFNRNVLSVVNRRFGADFDAEAFEHLAFWNARGRRMEMHLVATRAQEVRVRALDLRIRLRRGERIRTEVSCKYTRRSMARLLARAGLRLQRWLPADDGAFALALAGPAPAD